MPCSSGCGPPWTTVPSRERKFPRAPPRVIPAQAGNKRDEDRPFALSLSKGLPLFVKPEGSTYEEDQGSAVWVSPLLAESRPTAHEYRSVSSLLSNRDEDTAPRQPWVATIVRRVDQQLSPKEVHPKHSPMVGLLDERSLQATEMLAGVGLDILAFTAFSVAHSR